MSSNTYYLDLNTLPALSVEYYLGTQFKKTCRMLTEEHNAELRKELQLYMKKKTRTHQNVVKFIENYIIFYFAD
jgi:hypothetical protein